eukprot:scaffold31_cov312-Prasinococcus_capsulatus_cf.AAC.11
MRSAPINLVFQTVYLLSACASAWPHIRARLSPSQGRPHLSCLLRAEEQQTHLSSGPMPKRGRVSSATTTAPRVDCQAGSSHVS